MNEWLSSTSRLLNANLAGRLAKLRLFPEIFSILDYVYAANSHTNILLNHVTCDLKTDKIKGLIYFNEILIYLCSTLRWFIRADRNPRFLHAEACLQRSVLVSRPFPWKMFYNMSLEDRYCTSTNFLFIKQIWDFV